MMDPRMMDQLGLSDTQREQIRALHEQARTDSQPFQEQMKAGLITQDEFDQNLVVAQVKLAVAVLQTQREMRQKWKAGEITEQDYKQWLQKQAEELHQKGQPDIPPKGATP